MSEELDRLKTEEASLRANIDSLEKRLEDVPEREQEFGRITRDFQGSKDLYDSLLKRYGEAQVGESMEVDRQGERFRILEPALPPPSPIAPNRLQAARCRIADRRRGGRRRRARRRTVRSDVPQRRRLARVHERAGDRHDPVHRIRTPKAGAAMGPGDGVRSRGDRARRRRCRPTSRAATSRSSGCWRAAPETLRGTSPCSLPAIRSTRGS